MSLPQGTRLGPYEILTPLGAGGMGEVYKARDTRLDRLVAIKVLPEHLAHSPDALARLEREAKAVAALNHPNILGIHDFATHGDTPYVVMELLEGESLRTRLDQGPLPPRQATELAVQMAQGLAAAHDKGVVHRDLKPDNLWITREGRLKILDFGLAKVGPPLDQGADSGMPTGSFLHGAHTERGMILGTLGYMSPEQVRGEAVDARSDLFSFGAVLFEMLTGQPGSRRLSLGTWAHPMNLSGDGRLAVADDESAAAGPGYPLYLLPTDGATPTSLGKGFGCAFAPGGRRLCVWCPSGGNWTPVILNLDGGEEVLPTGDLETFANKPFGWNAQGEVLAYGKAKAGLWRIWRLLPAGPQALPWNAPDDVLDFIVPDAAGHALYVRRARQAWVQIDLSHPDLPPRPVPGTQPGDALLGLAADRNALFVAPPVADVAWRVDLRTGRREPLPVPKGTGIIQAVSEDGKGFLAKNYPATSRLFLVEGLK